MKILLLLVIILFAVCTLAQAQNAIPVTLAWDYTTAGQDGFVLYRKTGQTGAPAKITTPAVGPTLRTYTDTTAQAGLIYCYTVRATLGTFETKDSNEVCVANLVAPLNLRIQ